MPLLRTPRLTHQSQEERSVQVYLRRRHARGKVETTAPCAHQRRDDTIRGVVNHAQTGAVHKNDPPPGIDDDIVDVSRDTCGRRGPTVAREPAVARVGLPRHRALPRQLHYNTRARRGRARERARGCDRWRARGRSRSGRQAVRNGRAGRSQQEGTHDGGFCWRGWAGVGVGGGAKVRGGMGKGAVTGKAAPACCQARSTHPVTRKP